MYVNSEIGTKAWLECVLSPSSRLVAAHRHTETVAVVTIDTLQRYKNSRRATRQGFVTRHAVNAWMACSQDEGEFLGVIRWSWCVGGGLNYSQGTLSLFTVIILL